MHKYFVMISLLVSLTTGGPGLLCGDDKHTLQLDPSLIALDSPEGEQLLDESAAKKSYVPLSMHFTTQDTMSYCGVASICMVLNASHIERPLSQEHQPYRLFNQRNVFNEKVAAVAKVDQVRRSGMPLTTLGAIFATYPVHTEVVFAQDTTLETFRERAVSVLGENNQFLVVNYLRKSIKQESGGHISPIAAYHKGSDRFLIMDVARYKYPPVWVKADALWQAMQAGDGESRKSRGFVVVRPLKAE